MNHKHPKRLVSMLLAGVILLGLLSGALAPLPAAATETEGFSAAFAGAYAKVGQPMTVEVQNASGAVTYAWTVDGVSVGTGASYTPPRTT